MTHGILSESPASRPHPHRVHINGPARAVTAVGRAAATRLRHLVRCIRRPAMARGPSTAGAGPVTNALAWHHTAWHPTAWASRIPHASCAMAGASSTADHDTYATAAQARGPGRADACPAWKVRVTVLVPCVVAETRTRTDMDPPAPGHGHHRDCTRADLERARQPNAPHFLAEIFITQ